MLGPVKVQHPVLIAEGVVHAELHDLHHVSGILRCRLLPQLRAGTRLGQPDQRLQLPGGDWGGVGALPLLAQVKVKFLREERR